LNEPDGPDASWTAVSRRSRDTAFVRAKLNLDPETIRPGERGVAPRFPPQSMTVAIGGAQTFLSASLRLFGLPRGIDSVFVRSLLRRVFSFL